VCCSVLQCVAVCCNVLQCAAVCCSVLQCGVAVCCCSVLLLCFVAVQCCSVLLLCGAMCWCSVLQCVFAVCCTVLQSNCCWYNVSRVSSIPNLLHGGACCNMLQCVVASALQCVTVYFPLVKSLKSQLNNEFTI